jgi:hypothetical protein
MTMKGFILISLALTAWIGCGGEEPTLSEAETQQALVVVTGASAMAVATVDISTEGQVTVNASASCLAGGTITTTGTVSVSQSDVSYNLDLGFVGCTHGNITADGTLSYAGSVSEQAVSLSLAGTLSFAGAVEGTCSINIEQTIDVATGSIAMSGSACGNDVSFSLQGQL